MKKIFKKSISVLLAVVIVFSAAPLSGFIGLDLPEFGGLKKISDSVSDFFEGLNIKAEATAVSGYYTYSYSGGTATINYVDPSTGGDIIIPGELGGYPVDGISKNAFENCDKISSITFAVSNTKYTYYIGDNAFLNCTGLERVIFNEINLFSIGEHTFTNCNSLKSIILPENVIDVGGYAFDKCTSLETVQIYNEEFDLPGGVFRECSSLKAVNIPAKSEIIFSWAFEKCTSLEEITIPDSVKEVYQYAFADCTNLKTVSIGSGVSDIMGGAFNGCTSLETISIPDNVTSIGSYAFAGCTMLKSIDLPNDLESISAYMFSGCVNLKDVSIPSGVITIGKNSFRDCNSLDDIILPDGVTTIEEDAFSFCQKLTNITIPNSITNIKEGAFSGCYTLKDVYYKGTEEEWNSINLDIDENGILIDYATIHFMGEDSDSSDDDVVGFTSINKTVEYYSENEKKISIDVSLSAADFPSSSLFYNHNLASFCSQFVVVGYTKGENGSKLKSDKEKVLESALEKIGFESSDTEINLDTAEDEVNYFVTSQKVNFAGKTYNLVFAGFIGSNYGQWYTDFMPGTGVVHQGFMDARDFAYQKLAWYITKKGFNKDNTVILLTGHSRGAATANLVAAKLIDMEYFAYADNIHTYAFATPNSTTSKERTAQKYRRIFNIVNPEDFVTKVMPSKWGYGRYGVTLVLPSKTNSYNYNSHYSKMNSYFKILTGGDDYQPFFDGENGTYKVVKAFQSSVTSVGDFYSVNERHVNLIPTSPYEYFQKVMCPLVGERNVEDQIPALMMLAISAIPATTSTPYDKFSRYFLMNAVLYKIDNMLFSEEVDYVLSLISPILNAIDCTLDMGKPYFEHAHLADTYCAYMMTMSEDYLRENKSGYENTVNCPVDIEVYDNATNELVGKITNNVIDETIAAKANSIVMDVNGDSKSFWLPSDGDYRIVLTGNDEGTMDYTVSEVDSNTGETQRINFFDVEVEDNASMEGNITSEEFVLDEYTLTHEEIGTIESTEKISGDSVQNIIIKTSAEGRGYACGDITVISGDYVTVTAATDDSGIFMGWYENGVLVSSNAELSFVAKVSRNLVAKFSEVNLRTPSATTVKYSDKFILHADIKGKLPDGAKIVWEKSNENFEIVEVSDDGLSCKITPKSSGDTIFTVKVVSADDKILAEDTQTMTSKASFWDKIVAFFKGIFGLTKTIPQIYRGVF